MGYVWNIAIPSRPCSSINLLSNLPQGREAGKLYRACVDADQGSLEMHSQEHPHLSDFRDCSVHSVAVASSASVLFLHLKDKDS